METVQYRLADRWRLVVKITGTASLHGAATKKKCSKVVGDPLALFRLESNVSDNWQRNHGWIRFIYT